MMSVPEEVLVDLFVRQQDKTGYTFKNKISLQTVPGRYIILQSVTTQCKFRVNKLSSCKTFGFVGTMIPNFQNNLQVNHAFDDLRYQEKDSISPSTVICAALGYILSISPLRYHAQHILSTWSSSTKYALAHSFVLHCRVNFQITSGGIQRVYILSKPFVPEKMIVLGLVLRSVKARFPLFGWGKKRNHSGLIH